MTAQLNTLLRLRQYEVDRCQSQLAAAILCEQDVAERMTAVNRQRERQQQELAALTSRGQLNIDAVRIRQRHLHYLTDQHDKLRSGYEVAEQATRQRRELLLAADQRRQVVEKLRERLRLESQARQSRTQARDSA